MSSSDKLIDFLKYAPVPTYIWQARKGQLVLKGCNNAAVEITKGGINAYVGKTADDLYSELPEIKTDLYKCLNEKKSFSHNLKYTYFSTGEVKDLKVLYNYSPPDTVIIYTTDLTEHNEFKTVLADTEERFRSLADQTIVTMAIFQGGKIKYINSAVTSISGYTPQEIKTWSETDIYGFVHEDDRDVVSKRLEQLMASEDGTKERYLTYRLYTKDGDLKWIHQYARVILYEGFLALFVTLLDITDKINAEKALSRSEANARALINAITESIVLINKDMTVLTMNDAAARRMGLPKDKLVHKDADYYALNVFPADLTEERRQIIKKVFDDGVGNRVVDTRENVIYDTNYYPIIDKNGEVIQVAAFASDITDNARTAKAYQQSESRYRGLADLLPQTIYEMKLDGSLTFANRHGLETFSYSEDDLESGINVFDLFTDQSVRKIKSNIEARLAGKPEVDHQYIARRKDGSTFPIITYSSPIMENEKVVGLRGVLIDISDRIEAEQKLEQSEKRYRMLVQSVRSGIALIDFDGVFHFVNNNAAKSLGMEEADVVGKTMWSLFPHDIAEAQMQSIRQVIDTGNEMSRESRTYINNEWRWYISDLQPFSDLTVDKTSTMLIVTDITERKTAELRDNARLNLLNNIRHMNNINELLKAGCDAVMEANLFHKAVFLLLDKDNVIINSGVSGSDQTNLTETNLRLSYLFQSLDSTDNVPEQISGSYILNLNSVDKIKHENGNADFGNNGDWNDDSVLSVPLVVDENKHQCWMLVEKPYFRRKPEAMEIRYIEQIVEIVAKDIREVENLKKLQQERKTLEEKNITLREVLEHIEKEKLNIKRQFAKDVDQTLIPSLKRLVRPDGSVNKSYYDVLTRGLNELALSTGGLLHLYTRLTSREIDICNMIKSGATSEEIASDLYITLSTVKKHRQKIRRKFGLLGKKVNLESYLRQL